MDFFCGLAACMSMVNPAELDGPGMGVGDWVESPWSFGLNLEGLAALGAPSAS